MLGTRVLKALCRLFTLLLLSACATGPVVKTPPGDVPQLIGNILIALDRDGLFVESLYSEPELRALTSGTEIRTESVAPPPTPILRTTIDKLALDPGHRGAPSIEIWLSRTIEAGRIIAVSGNVSLAESHVTPNDILSYVGGRCREDRPAERDDAADEPRTFFEPPPIVEPILTCDLAKTDAVQHKHITLEFGPANRLKNVAFKAE